MFRYLLRMLSLFGIVSVLLTTPAYASRLALVIGNGDYRPISNQLKLEALRNPVNDAIDMTNALKGLGFEVILKTEVNEKAMKQAIRDFGRRLSRLQGGVGLFFFSGHGFQYKNVNYLLPLRADIESGVDIEDEAVKANYVLRQMEQANSGVNLIILDACRESLPEEFFKDRNNKGFFDGLNVGLADMRAPTGSLIAYSMSPSKTSWGGLLGERNSVYTKHLLKTLQRQAYLSVTDLFIEVRNRVMQETKAEEQQQVPWESVSLTQRFCFGQCGFGCFAILRRCETHFRANRLTTGRGGTALACYEEVLQQDKNNAKALAGLDNIEAKYVGWIERFLNQGKRRKAARYLASLRKVNPHSPKIEAFEERLQPTNPPIIPAPQVSSLPSTEPSTHHVFRPGKVFRDRLRDGSQGPKMVWIPAGSFRMGDIQGGGYSNEQPVHQVSVKRFAMGTHEITVGEFRRFVNATGYKMGGCTYPSGKNWRNPGFSQSDNHPVVCISWNDATAYAEWLTQQTNQQYRLPTEAEWEYAARAGSSTKYWWDNNIGSNRANCYKNQCGDRFEYTAPVGSFQSNPFGLYDAVKNVWEWTCSEYENSYNGKEKRCLSKNRAKSEGLFVLRGGSWIYEAGWARTANRLWWTRTVRIWNDGARLVRIE